MNTADIGRIECIRSVRRGRRRHGERGGGVGVLVRGGGEVVVAQSGAVRRQRTAQKHTQRHGGLGRGGGACVRVCVRVR